MTSLLLFVRAFLAAWGTSAVAEDRPLPPAEARAKIGKAITVEMKVSSAKDRLEKRGEIYLDSEEDFKSDKNFAVVINRAGAAKFKESGIADPAEHFRGKTIRASGTVKEVDKVPRIEVDSPAQIKIVDKK